jgi:hypothetical protein
MFRKLFFAAALVAVAAVSTPQPAPAIDFICTCQVCHGGTGPACRDLKAPFPGGFIPCSSWWAAHANECS